MHGILFARILHMSGSSFELYRFIYILDDYSIKLFSEIDFKNSNPGKKKGRRGNEKERQVFI